MLEDVGGHLKTENREINVMMIHLIRKPGLFRSLNRRPFLSSYYQQRACLELIFTVVQPQWDKKLITTWEKEPVQFESCDWFLRYYTVPSL